MLHTLSTGGLEVTAPLKRFFDSLTSEVELERLIQEGREEDIHLEFKQKADARSPAIGERDRSSFSKALSGFANADGGVLIWGVETTKGANEIDRASSLRPIADHGAFRSRLIDSTLNATHPVVDGVVIEAIQSSAGSGGFVKCWIPASDRPPHRGVLADREYWRRVVSGYRRMEHYELEDVFGRRSRPILKVRASLKPRPEGDPHEEVHLRMLNEGRGVAKHAGLWCLFEDVQSCTGRDGLHSVSSLNSGRPIVQHYSSQSVVHPNGIWSALGHAIILRPNKGAELRMTIRVYAENMETRVEEIAVEPGAEAIG
jgi:hypothetical protein